MNKYCLLPLLALLTISSIGITGCETKTLPPVFKDAHYFSDHDSSLLNLPRVYYCIDAHDEVPRIDMNIDADLPDVPEELTVYSIIRPKVDEDYATQIASKLGFSGEPEILNSSSFTLDAFRFWNGGQAVEIFHDGSIAIYYVNDPGKPSSLPSDEECIEIAKEWLEDNGLYPENVISISASPNMVTVAKDSAEGVQIIDIYSRNISVSFTIGIDGYEVQGMGAYVAVGEDGEILQAYINTPQFKKYTTVSLRRLDAALETFGDYLDYPQQFYADTPKCLLDRVGSEMYITDISIKYFCMLSEENAVPVFAQPIYVLNGYYEENSWTGSFTGGVDAVIR